MWCKIVVNRGLTTRVKVNRQCVLYVLYIMCGEKKSESGVKRANWPAVRTEYVLQCHILKFSSISFEVLVHAIPSETSIYLYIELNEGFLYSCRKSVPESIWSERLVNHNKDMMWTAQKFQRKQHKIEGRYEISRMGTLALWKYPYLKSMSYFYQSLQANSRQEQIA